MDLQDIYKPTPELWATMTKWEKRPHVAIFAEGTQEAMENKNWPRVRHLHSVGLRYHPRKEQTETQIMVMPSAFIRIQREQGKHLEAGNSKFLDGWSCGCCKNVHADTIGLKKYNKNVKGLSLLRFVGLDARYRTLCTLCLGLMCSVRAMDTPPLNSAIIEATLSTWLAGNNLVAVVCPSFIWRKIHGFKKNVIMFDEPEAYTNWWNASDMMSERLLFPLAASHRPWNELFHQYHGLVPRRPTLPQRPLFYGPDPDPEVYKWSSDPEKGDYLSRTPSPLEIDALKNYLDCVAQWKKDVAAWSQKYLQNVDDYNLRMFVQVKTFLKEDMASCFGRNQSVTSRMAPKLKKVFKRLKQDDVFPLSPECTSTTIHVNTTMDSNGHKTSHYEQIFTNAKETDGANKLHREAARFAEEANNTLGYTPALHVAITLNEKEAETPYVYMGT